MVDCNKTELRKHVLGDIYHSQLIEVGPPDGDVIFTNKIKKLILDQ